MDPSAAVLVVVAVICAAVGFGFVVGRLK